MKRSCLIIGGLLVASLAVVAVAATAVWFRSPGRRVAREVAISLPDAAAKTGVKVAIHLPAGGGLTIDGTAVPDGGLASALQGVAQRDPRARVSLRMDRNRRMDELTAVMDACHAAGLHQVSFTTTKSAD